MVQKGTPKFGEEILKMDDPSERMEALQMWLGEVKRWKNWFFDGNRPKTAYRHEDLVWKLEKGIHPSARRACVLDAAPAACLFGASVAPGCNPLISRSEATGPAAGTLELLATASAALAGASLSGRAAAGL